MTWWQALILGLVQGVTEFLPVSSSGHLALGSSLMEIPAGSVFFEVVLHLATLGAIIVFFNSQLLRLRRHEIVALVVGTLPAVVVGLGFKDQIESLFGSVLIVSLALMVTGIFNLVADRLLQHRSPSVSLETISWKNGLVVGLFQALAITPGISRSGSTVLAGLSQDLDRESAFRFSFLLAIPAVAGAGVLQLKDLAEGGFVLEVGWVPLTLGAVAAFVSGLLSLKLFKIILTSARLELFGWYCLVIGSLGLLSQLI